ncbi:MAG: phosphomannomutase [Mariprofundaceae bacterium]|nr:phosphomannomutase [Mariprofundaceae bacterium]
MSRHYKNIQISSLMQKSGVKFGTSGARGLVKDMTDEVCYAYTLAFIQHLHHIGDLKPKGSIAIAGDYRSSSPRILAAVAMAIRASDYTPIYCGFIPTPAVAFYAMTHHMPCMMITGSHIPDDRNGIKFYKSDGEILKEDEQSMAAQQVSISIDSFHDNGSAIELSPLPPEHTDAYHIFIQRYLAFFPKDCFAGQTIAVYEHSTVARDALGEILEGLGAEVIRLGRSAHFLPVDTEAIRPEDVQLAQDWAKEYAINCIVSADGDGDRPLISDEHGNWLRGDVAGILCAHYLGAESIATPVSCNSAIEKSGWFKHIVRTRIGSPFVIEAMNHALQRGEQAVVGYEANGGFLTASSITMEARTLAALPTRDAIIVPLSILLMATQKNATISALLKTLPPRFTSSGRLKNFPSQLSKDKLLPLKTSSTKENIRAAQQLFGNIFGNIKHIDTTDGIRITFDSEEVAHLRPSGNAPELRCYNEANSEQRALEMNLHCMKILATWQRVDS